MHVAYSTCQQVQYLYDMSLYNICICKPESLQAAESISGKCISSTTSVSTGQTREQREARSMLKPPCQALSIDIQGL